MICIHYVVPDEIANGRCLLTSESGVYLFRGFHRVRCASIWRAVEITCAFRGVWGLGGQSTDDDVRNRQSFSKSLCLFNIVNSFGPDALCW